MKTLFALGTGVVLGTIAALWLAARGVARGDTPAMPPEGTTTPPLTSVSEEAPQ